MSIKTIELRASVIEKMREMDVAYEPADSSVGITSDCWIASTDELVRLIEYFSSPPNTACLEVLADVLADHMGEDPSDEMVRDLADALSGLRVAGRNLAIAPSPEG